MAPSTLFEKIWDAHVVVPPSATGGPRSSTSTCTWSTRSPRRRPSTACGWRAGACAARTAPSPRSTTTCRPIGREAGIADPLSAAQVEALERNCAEFGIPLFSLRSPRQGIVHVIGPELGVTQPGMTIVCGDSHTSTHGAFGALAFGIGTSEVEHVLATQTLPQATPRTMRVEHRGRAGRRRRRQGPDPRHHRRASASPARAGTSSSTPASAIRALSMEGRMTVCNMSIEGGARAGMIAPDDTTFAWLDGRPGAPGGPRRGGRVAGARCRSDAGAVFDREEVVDAASPRPAGHLGHQPGHGRAGHRPRAHAGRRRDAERRATASQRALEYMGLHGGEAIEDIAIDAVFIGSCTNGRLADLRAAAEVVRGRRVAAGVRAMVVPGSHAGEGRGRGRGPRPRSSARPASSGATPGCSMCLAMNDDVLAAGRALRLDQQPQLRGPPGQGRPHPPRQPADGRRGGDRRAPGGRPRVRRRAGGGGLMRCRSRASRASSARSTAPTSTPTRSSPSSSSSASSAPASASSSSADWRGAGGLPARPRPSTRARRSSSPAATSAAARRASTRPGRSRTTASGRSSRRASPTSSAPTAQDRPPAGRRCRADEVADLLPAPTAEPGVTAAVDLELAVVVDLRGPRDPVRDRARRPGAPAQRLGRHRPDARPRGRDLPLRGEPSGTGP